MLLIAVNALGGVTPHRSPRLILSLWPDVRLPNQLAQAWLPYLLDEKRNGRVLEVLRERLAADPGRSARGRRGVTTPLAELVTLPGVDHIALINRTTAAWVACRDAVERLLD